MVGTQATGADKVALDAVLRLHVGNVFLAGRSHDGTTATKAVVAKFTSAVAPATTANLPLFVATDQEGGEVQVLNGPGFDAMPSALQQGAMAPEALKDDARRWGAQLAASGVNMNLAPVVDLIASPAAAANNPPIGGFDRQFGYTPAIITSHADAFRAGMDTAGVVPVIKHFPGLGAVTENTDTNSGVTDSTTTATSASVGVFRTQIEHSARVVMVSTAIYAKIDPRSPAAFSRTIVTGLLRGTLGFDGVVMSDDLSAAPQTQAWSPADRAIDAIEAGVDIVLISADPSLAPEMVSAVVAKAQSDPAFAKQVDAAARHVVQLKRQQF
jgi:beta-N-acetylhexosaminidase